VTTDGGRPALLFPCCGSAARLAWASQPPRGSCRCVIVNGVLDAAGLDTGLLPNAEVTICRLRAGASEVERRLLARDGQRGGQAGLGPLTGDWPGFTEDIEDAAGRAALSPGPPAGGQVALITGPAGVGKSTIGFRLYQRCLQAGLTAGYVDLGQIGLVRPADAGDPGHQRLRARNLAAIWRNYRAAGATHLVATGAIGSPADLGRYAREMQGAGVTLIRLRAGSDELRRRILSRGAGGSWPEPGDRLLDRTDGGGVPIDTTGRSPGESAGLIAGVLRWFP
jgi:hypothetical protein